MAEQFGRKIRVQVGSVVVEQNRVKFNVKTSLRSKPNIGSIDIYNLNESKRDEIDSLVDTGSIQLDAGYATTGVGTIFIGNISRAGSRWDNGDWITTIEAGDGRRAMRRRRVNASHAAGTPAEQILRQVGGALGIGQGNLDRIASRITGSVASTRTVSGNAAAVLDELTRDLGLEWSVQRGNLQFVERGAALAGEAIVLKPGSGLIGSPERNKDGTVTAESVIIPDLFPGRQIRILSRKITGNFRVQTAEYAGDTHGPDWKITSVGREV